MNLNLRIPGIWITLYLNLWRQKSWIVNSPDKLVIIRNGIARLPLTIMERATITMQSLLRLHPDYVKIDMSIVRNIDTKKPAAYAPELIVIPEIPADQGNCRGCGDIAEMETLFVWHRLPSGLLYRMPEITPATTSIRADGNVSCTPGHIS